MYGTALHIKYTALLTLKIIVNLLYRDRDNNINHCIDTFCFNLHKQQSENETTMNRNPSNKMERTSFWAAWKA